VLLVWLVGASLLLRQLSLKMCNQSRRLLVRLLRRHHLLPHSLLQQQPAIHMVCTRGMGYMDVVEALLPHRNVSKIFLPIFDFEKIFHTSKY
jgi:hypothetical protein